MPAISRFQAAAVGSSVFIHNHRSLSDMLVLDAADPAAPKLALRPIAGAEGTPMSRCGLTGSSAACCWLPCCEFSEMYCAGRVVRFSCNLLTFVLMTDLRPSQCVAQLCYVCTRRADRLILPWL